MAATDWRPVIRPPAALPSLANGPLTAVIDDAVDTGHPDLAGVSVTRHASIADRHGTAVASLVGGRANGVGMVGVLPGAPLLSIGTTFTTGDIVGAIAHAVDAGARIVNMSFGSPFFSFGIYREIAYAVSQGVLPVAAAGNDRQSELPDGTRNPVQFPAALPHVLSVASMGPSGASSSFATSNGAVDASAPGEAVLAAVPAALDLNQRPPTGTRAWMGPASRRRSSPGPPPGCSRRVRSCRRRRPPTCCATRRATSAPPAGIRTRATASSTSGGRSRGPPRRSTPARWNDDIEWVDGRRFSRPDRFLFQKRHRRRRVDASVDLWKDPADVYRVQVRPRTRVRLTLTMPRREDVDLAAFGTRARTIERARGLLGASLRLRRRDGQGDDRRRPALARRLDVAVIHGGPQADFLNATYRLTVTRLVADRQCSTRVS